MSNFERIPRRAFLERARRRGVRIAMDALAGATVVVDPEPYVGRLAAASPCADTANDAASTSGGSRGVPLFDAAPVPPSNDPATTVKVVEDLAVFAGGAVWCLDWAPARGGAETRPRKIPRAADDDAKPAGAPDELELKDFLEEYFTHGDACPCYESTDAGARARPRSSSARRVDASIEAFVGRNRTERPKETTTFRPRIDCIDCVDYTDRFVRASRG